MSNHFAHPQEVLCLLECILFIQPDMWGYDFRRDMEVDHESYGEYATDLFTDESVDIINNHNSSMPLFLYLAHLAVHSANVYDPLQAPADIVEKFSYIADENRRKYAGMLWKLDESVGKVVKALQDNMMLENSVIVFTTDNGGAAGGFDLNVASNWPLRGMKASMWEGGVRGASFVWSPLIKNPGRVSMEMMQIMDWLPTLYRAAGGNVSNLPSMNGMDVWSSIADEDPSPRNEMLLNIDLEFNGAGLRVGDYKLLFNPSGYGQMWDGWFGPSGRNLSETYFSNEKLEEKSIKTSLAGKAIQQILPNAYRNINKLKKSAEILCHEPVPENATIACNSTENPCLFHIPSDPCEYYDISYQNPEIVQLMLNILKSYNDTAVPPVNQPFDPKANPKYWSYTWTNWQDYDLGTRFKPE